MSGIEWSRIADRTLTKTTDLSDKLWIVRTQIFQVIDWNRIRFTQNDIYNGDLTPKVVYTEEFDLNDRSFAQLLMDCIGTSKLHINLWLKETVTDRDIIDLYTWLLLLERWYHQVN